MHATLALANGQSVTGRVKNSVVTRQSEMGVRVKPEAFANAPAVEYYHAQTGRRIDERDILQMSLPERAKFVVRPTCPLIAHAKVEPQANTVLRGHL